MPLDGSAGAASVGQVRMGRRRHAQEVDRPPRGRQVAYDREVVVVDRAEPDRDVRDRRCRSRRSAPARRHRSRSRPSRRPRSAPGRRRDGRPRGCVRSRTGRPPRRWPMRARTRDGRSDHRYSFSRSGEPWKRSADRPARSTRMVCRQLAQPGLVLVGQASPPSTRIDTSPAASPLGSRPRGAGLLAIHADGFVPVALDRRNLEAAQLVDHSFGWGPRPTTSPTQ